MRKADGPLLPERPEDAATRERFSRMGWGLLISQLAGGAVQLLTVLAAKAFWCGLEERALFQWTILILANYGVGFPVFVRIIRTVPAGPARERRPMGAFQLVHTWAMAFSAVLAGNLVTLWAGELLRQLTGWSMADPVQGLMAGPVVPRVLMTCVLAPVCEEVMFRGLLFSRLRPYGDRFAVLATALLFGLFHGNLSQMLYAMAFGLVLGDAAARTGCLWQCILIHSAVNALTGVLAPALTGSGAMGERLLSLLVAVTAVWSAAGIAARLRQSAKAADRSGEERPWGLFFRNSGMCLFCLLTALLCISCLR